jgi:UDP-N-acetylglucosamine 2-epimerase (hydrolysing)
MKKKILFITGTRADFGKLKPLMQEINSLEQYEYAIFATGMHQLSKYGKTFSEIEKSGFTNIFPYINQVDSDDMEMILANTIQGLSRYLHETKVDLIVVHGDRVEALAGAITGSLRNILVAHVEGGEISGTIDELIRHSISKLSHIHFVATDTAKKRLLQLGEEENTIYQIGSPDVDVMLSDNLPNLTDAMSRYQVTYENYAIAILHPVTTDSPEIQRKNAQIFVESLLDSQMNYIVIYPNNDSGSSEIFSAYEKLTDRTQIMIFPSLRFEYFLTFLKNCEYIIGNSSAGIHEAPIYAVPTINIGTRQENRFSHETIFDTTFSKSEILEAIRLVRGNNDFKPAHAYGIGKSAQGFREALSEIWSLSNQKQFRDLNF